MTSSRQSSEKGEQATSAVLGASELEQCKSTEIKTAQYYMVVRRLEFSWGDTANRSGTEAS